MNRLNLEDFSAPQPAAQQPVAQPEPPDTQDMRLNAYENGYKAGWDDATAAEAEARTRIAADFAKTLQEMSFSYHEARAHVLGALGPLLNAMVERVIPQIAADGFARTVVETAMQIADAEVDRPVRMRVCPENRDALEELVGRDPGLPLVVVEDDTLGPGQALVSAGTAEKEIDIDGTLSAIRTALEDFLTTQEETRRHG
ncbi:flagellar biosynthesis protein [Rhodovulum euryhalinum]|uniref:Flagellar assembly protein FliH n=1 Tax=Rhodovulum euryhalinum TaxID=35805 RepID=A0A4R2KT71_9RHOB|nr:flagellar biosynthesis protein [Rhodovulum euryhalinum]TCO73378.1 flagellar assembly protein FliH [Rhodovulum euryhalinum]